MKIRTQTGTILHVEKSPLTQILLDAGLCTIVQDAAPKPLQPTKWDAGIVQETGEPYLIATCANGACASSHRTHRALGPTAAKAIFWHCGRGETAPAEVVKKFESLRAGAAED